MATNEDEANSPYIENENVYVPGDIELSSTAIELAFHPNYNILAAGTLDGPIKIFSYSSDVSKSNHRLMSFRYHKKSCRSVEFSPCGNYLFTGSSDATIGVVDLNSGAIVKRLSSPLSSAIYSLHPINNYLLASGMDNGNIILWDFRLELPIVTTKICEGYLSCLRTTSDKRNLLATSGDGIISSFNLNTREIQSKSESTSNEMLAFALAKKDKKVVVGSSDGSLNIYTFDDWDTYENRHILNAGSIGAIVPISDNIIVAGCADGRLRVLTVEPNIYIGVVGNHHRMPVESLSVSRDKKFIASCSYDHKIKFHGLSVIRNADIKPHTKPKRPPKGKILIT